MTKVPFSHPTAVQLKVIDGEGCLLVITAQLSERENAYGELNVTKYLVVENPRQHPIDLHHVALLDKRTNGVLAAIWG